MGSLDGFEFVAYEATSKGVFGGDRRSYATVKIRVGSITEHRHSEGKGPVDALEKAMRKALEPHFPNIKKTKIKDYRVQISNGGGGESPVKVSILFSDGKGQWRGLAESTDIIEASVIALDACFCHAIANGNLQKA